MTRDVQRNGRRGFSLIELLLAVTLYGVALLLVASTLQGGILVWKRDQAKAERGQPVELFAKKLAQELENHVAFHPLPFQGTSSELWLTILTEKRVENRLQPFFVRVHYWMEGETLMREEIEASSLLDTRRVREFPSMKTEWLRGLRKFKIQYALVNDEKKMIWTDGWENQEKVSAFPMAVKVELAWMGKNNQLDQETREFWVPDGWPKMEAGRIETPKTGK